jgi:V8-like Glu-specific endopeptidase
MRWPSRRLSGTGRRAGRPPHPGQSARTLIAAGAGAGVLLTVLLVPAAPSAERLATRLAAAAHTLGIKARMAKAGQRYPAPAGTSAAVGALFTTGTTTSATSGSTVVAVGRRHEGRRLGSHFCTASVVNSPAGNLVLTAAHCLAGLSPSQIVFVPEYRDGAAPYGVWPVTRAVVDEAWSASASPDDDMAFLLVRQPGTKASVQSFTGGERLGFGQPPRQPVRVTGYPDNAGAPVSCLNQATPFGAVQLEFDCAGFATGTSGSALLADVSPVTGLGTVLGIIGGYQQGGDTASVSYADRVGAVVAALYKRATGR